MSDDQNKPGPSPDEYASAILKVAVFALAVFLIVYSLFNGDPRGDGNGIEKSVGQGGSPKPDAARRFDPPLAEQQSLPAPASAAPTFTAQATYPPLVENGFEVVGPTSSRPGDPAPGQRFFDTDLNTYSIFTGTSWQAVNTSAGIGNLDDIGDVSAVSPSLGEFLGWNGAAWSNLTLSLSTLTDAEIAGATPGQSLRFNGSNFVNANLGVDDIAEVIVGAWEEGETLRYNGTNLVDSKLSLYDLSNITVSSPANGQTLTYNSSTGRWVNSTTSLSTNLDGLSDVVITAAVNGEFLGYNGTNWVDRTISFDTLSDVTINLPAVGQSVRYNGSAFVNATLDVDDLANTTITSWSTGEVLRYNGTALVDATLSIDDLSEVAVTSWATGEVLRYNGTSLVDSKLIFGTDLSDVAITAAASGDFIGWNGSAWADLTISLDTMADATITTPTDGQILSYDADTSQWVNASIPVSVTALGDLEDVDIDTPADNQFFRYDGTNWVNETVTIPVSIDDLSDVAIVSQSAGEVLRSNGTAFVDATLSVDDLTEVAITSFAAGETLRFNGTSLVDARLSVDDLSEVNITSWGVGETLRWNGSELVDSKLAVGDLSNVVLTSPASGQFLEYNGTNFINSAISTSDLSDFNVVAPSDNQFLRYDSGTSKFVNETVDVPADALYFVVTEYGATVGDGSDDRSAINSAITAAESAAASTGVQAVVFFPEGVYDSAGQVQINGTGNVQLVGYGAKIRSQASASNQLLYASADNITVRGLEFDCDYPTVKGAVLASDTAQAGGTQGSGSTHGTIKLSAIASGDPTGLLIEITGGACSGQVRFIESYVAGTKVATIAGVWDGAAPDATSTYTIYSGLGIGVNSDADNLVLADVVIRNTKGMGSLLQYGRVDFRNVRIIEPGLSGVQCKADEHYFDALYVENWNHTLADLNVRAVEADGLACDAEILSIVNSQFKMTEGGAFTDAILVDNGDGALSEDASTAFGSSGAATEDGDDSDGAGISHTKWTLDAGHGFQVGDMTWVTGSSVSSTTDGYNRVHVIKKIEGTGNVWVNVVDANTVRLYNSPANAEAGGATGLVDLSTGSATGTTYISCTRSKTKFAISGLDAGDDELTVTGHDFRTGQMARLFRGTPSTVMYGGLAGAGTITTDVPFNSGSGGGTGASYTRPKRTRHVVFKNVDIDYMTSTTIPSNAIKINNTESVTLDDVRITSPPEQNAIENYSIRIGQGNRDVTLRNVRMGGRFIVNEEAYVPRLTILDSEFGDGSGIPNPCIESFSAGQFTMQRCTLRSSGTFIRMPIALLRWDDKRIIEWDIANNIFELQGSTRGVLFRTSFSSHLADIAGRVKWHDNILRSSGYAGLTVSGVSTGAGTDYVTTSGRHWLRTGDLVRFDASSAPGGLTNNASYYVRWISSTQVAFYDTKADAFADTNRIDLTSGGSTRVLNYPSAGITWSNTDDDRGWAIFYQTGVTGNEFVFPGSVPSSTAMAFRRGNILHNAHAVPGMPLRWVCSVDGTVGANCGTFAEELPYKGNILYSTIAEDANSTTGAVEDLLSYTIPANTLANDGDRLVIQTTFKPAADGDDKRVLVVLGANTLYDSGSVTAHNGGAVIVESTVIRENATLAKITTHVFASGSGSPIANSGYTSNIVTDFATDLTLKGQCECETAGDISQEILTVRRNPAP